MVVPEVEQTTETSLSAEFIGEDSGVYYSVGITGIGDLGAVIKVFLKADISKANVSNCFSLVLHVILKPSS